MFKFCAYSSLDRHDLLDGLDAFMDHSLVLPYGQTWDKDTLYPVLERIIEKHKVEEHKEEVKRKGELNS